MPSRSPPSPDTPPPLSFAQERLWYINAARPGTPLYNLPLAWTLNGPLDTTALTRALNDLMTRHDALRTVFTLADDQPVQTTSPPAPVDVPLIDLSDLPDTVQDASLAARLTKKANTPFDLSTGPLLRASIYRLNPTHHVLSIVVHHIAFDGGSRPIFLAELATLYAAFTASAPSPLPPLPLQYSDYAVWQRTTADEADMARQLAYWKRTYESGVPPLEIYPDHPCPAERTHHGGTQRRTLPADMAASLRSTARAEDVTPFIYLLAVYAATLHRVTNQDELAIALPVADRGHPDADKLIGFFVNTMILRARTTPTATFRELLRDVRGECLDAFGNMTVPFQRVVEAIRPDRTSALTPLFQTIFAFADLRTAPQAIGDLRLNFLPVAHDGALTDLVMEISWQPDAIDCALTYSTDLFNATTATRILRHFETILQHTLRNPEIALKDIPLLTDDDRARLAKWHDTRVDFEREDCVHHRVAQQAARTPHTPAIVGVDAQGTPVEITYDELNRRANRVAHYLHRQGIGPGYAVGVFAERTPHALVSVLGILKSGAAYVPLDPDYPTQRLTIMLQDAGISTVLATTPTSGLPADLPADPVYLDSPDHPAARQPDRNPSIEVGLADQAYILFTSGSTGTPKGVVMPHGPLANLIAWQTGNSIMGAGNRTLHFAPLSFDVSFQELFATWCSGGTLVLVPNDTRLDGHDLVDFINTQRVERLFIPFVGLQMLAEAAPHAPPVSLKEIMTAGEQLQITPQVIDLFAALPDCALYNHYGPTEAHVVTSLKLTGNPHDWPARPSIGRPVDNVQIHILDPYGHATPVGQPGELYIGGAAVARGYLNRPELSAETFVPDTFGEDTHARLYRSGDLARYLPDGTIEFLGRADSQLKVRGFRVEPGEIEAALAAHEGITQSVVTLWGDTPADQRLTAYFVCPDGIPPPHRDRAPQTPAPDAARLHGATVL